MAVHHDGLRVLWVLGVGMVWVGEGGVGERGVLHRVRRARFDGCAWGSLSGTVLLLLLLLGGMLLLLLRI
jgi:hypothetical protein